MPRIFISYRRADTITITGRIYDRLVAAFGEDSVFKDVDNIPLGADFRTILEHEVATCDLLLAIIGPQWLTVIEKDGTRRIDNPNDAVRIEVQTGIKRDDVIVIPVLVTNASMPMTDQLPATLADLSFRNAAIVRDDPDFNHDMIRLITQIKEQFAAQAPAAVLPAPITEQSSLFLRWQIWAAVGVIVVVTALGLNFFARGDFGQPTNTPIATTLLPSVADSETPKATATQRPSVTPTTEATITPIPSNTISPNLTALAQETSLPTSANTMQVMTFLEDVNIPDGTQFKPGQTFTKVWRVRNDGASRLSGTLNFSSGDKMGAPDSVPLPPLASGETGTISVDFIAPSTFGLHRSVWQPTDDEGRPFNFELYVEIKVVST